MTETLEVLTPDLDAVKRRQQETWASGDYSLIASRIVLAAEQLCDTADLHAGWHVLDVATGSGNAASRRTRRPRRSPPATRPRPPTGAPARGRRPGGSR